MRGFLALGMVLAVSLLGLMLAGCNMQAPICGDGQCSLDEKAMENCPDDCEVAAKSCTDSDGGLNYNTRGGVTGTLPKGFVSQDKCLSAKLLREVYCSNGMAAARQYECPYSCELGACKPAPAGYVCGNGRLEKGEQCDDGNRNNGDGCSSSCINEVNPICGNNRLEIEETCDGTDLGGKRCNDFTGFTGGTLKCTSDCKSFDTSQCETPVNNCGNGVLDSGEECDGTVIPRSCVQLGFAGGDMSCTNCRFNTAACVGTCAGPCCTNQVCEPGLGETATSCPSDCLSTPTGRTVFVNPHETAIGNGDGLILDVRIANVQSLLGFQFDIYYNPQVLQFMGVSEGSVLNAGGQSTYCMNYDATEAGRVRNLVCTRLGSAGAAGNGVLERLSFTAIAPGVSDITLSNVVIGDANANKIQVAVSSGRVTVR